MLRGHVFIVNENTLPIHLEHMFVGTSAGERDNNISLLADMLRIKENDFIFFYIEGRKTEKGRFFGIFKAVDDTVYHLTNDDAKQPNLSVKLIYRKKIRPYKVYPKGVLEWVALDKLPTYAKELLWTLIYRKMKGRRGNTMLFPWEVERLISLIEDENQGQFLTGNYFTFDKNSYEIKKSNHNHILNHNIGNPINVSVNDLRKSETHFQAFILQNLSLNKNNFLSQIFGENLIWIGNEVFAGSGMQKIDILTIEKTDETTYLYRLIELKHPKSSMNVNFAPMQLKYYINWAREDIGGHILGSKKFNIKPILLVFRSSNVSNVIPSNIVADIKKLNSISLSPEIYEIDSSLKPNRIL